MSFHRIAWLPLFCVSSLVGCHCGPDSSADGGSEVDGGVPDAGDGRTTDAGGSSGADGGIWGACSDAAKHMCWDYAGTVSEQTRLVDGPAECGNGGGAWGAKCQAGQAGTCELHGSGDVRTYWRFYAGANLSVAPTVCAAGGGSWTTP